jgi:hypothetical protein
MLFNKKSSKPISRILYPGKTGNSAIYLGDLPLQGQSAASADMQGGQPCPISPKTIETLDIHDLAACKSNSL